MYNNIGTFYKSTSRHEEDEDGRREAEEDAMEFRPLASKRRSSVCAGDVAMEGGRDSDRVRVVDRLIFFPPRIVLDGL